MTFPSATQLNTQNLDSADDDPSLARADILATVQAVNAIIASENTAFGVAVLDSTGQIPGTRLPATITATGTQTLQPTSGVISLRNVARLYPLVSADIGTYLGTTAPSAGDVIFVTDGDAGSPCLAVYDGSVYRVVRLMTQIGSVGAALTVSVTLTGEAD